VYEWIEMFKNCRTSVTDAECLGYPTTATTAQSLQWKHPSSAAKKFKAQVDVDHHLGFSRACS
jgi:hypothetical protein